MGRIKYTPKFGQIKFNFRECISSSYASPCRLKSESLSYCSTNILYSAFNIVDFCQHINDFGKNFGQNKKQPGVDGFISFCSHYFIIVDDVADEYICVSEHYAFPLRLLPTLLFLLLSTKDWRSLQSVL